MYIEKRWLVPAALSLLLLGTLFAAALLLVGSRVPRLSGSLRLADISNVELDSEAPGAVASAAPSSPLTQAPEEVVDIATAGTTQINTRGFGDVGLQFHNVEINAPITIVHVSNQGNNNSTNVSTAENDRIVSEQEHLESNRSDGTPN
ncbi:MAG: hypothetical protein QOD63_2694 [Actinomycetota bacterium]|jgi:hypothetical protein|nr:hypothetical protein [Actinomycetota bacterium]